MGFRGIREVVFTNLPHQLYVENEGEVKQGSQVSNLDTTVNGSAVN